MLGYANRVLFELGNVLRIGLGRLAKVGCLLLLAVFGVTPAAAQTYVNGTDGTINGATTCTSPLVRNFNVSDSFTVADVDLGVYATHTWRGDIRITLRAPDGTQVQLVNGDANNVSGDNFNVRLDDSGTQQVNTDSATGNHSTTAPPPFQNQFSPDSPLSAFNGVASNGTWRLEICDIYPSADNGVFRHAELYLTALPANYADLSLQKSVDNSAPVSGTGITYTLQVTNSSGSPSTATGIEVTDALPLGVDYVSHSGAGSYDPTTGIWQVGSLAPGANATLTITGTVTATSGATITNNAEITASSITDSDSTPGNGVIAEDDYDEVSLTVAGSRVAGTPPTLLCTAGDLLFDWNPLTWTAGSTNNSYSFGTLGQVNFALTNPGVWLDNATFGGQSPLLQNVMNGGLGTGEDSLIQLVNMPSQSDVATTTITLPRSVMGAQFRIFDVDYGVNQFADRIEVTGSYRGATVLPTLTNGIANYVIGNTAYGDATSDSDAANGNIVVTFDQPIDTIIVQYGNHSLAPADPGQQGIAVHDFTFCQPTTSLSATKVSAVFSDPINDETDPKAIPGAMIDYTISVTNTGSVEVDDGSVSIVDTVPADTKMCLADWSANSGPVQFTNGTPSSGLTYSYDPLGGVDDLSFSNDGGLSYSYAPVADGDGCDPSITNFRVEPSGAFLEGTSFLLRARFKVL